LLFTRKEVKKGDNMSQSLIERIERKIENSKGMSSENKEELIKLLKTLRSEMVNLEEKHSDNAESIAGFAGAAAHEAMRTETNPQLLQLAMDGLTSSVEEVESEHPQLVEITNSICTMLSNLGI
jgi:ATP-dependent protease HslVU (ClpYQ) peptidase subunit